MKAAYVVSLLLALAFPEMLLGAATRIEVRLPADAGPIPRNIRRVFADQVERRCAAKVVEDGPSQLVVELSIKPNIGKEGFEIVDGTNGGIRIVGNDDRGLLHGVGKFLHTSRYDQGGFTAGAWRGRSVPTSPVRAIYFATHFHNFYHDAPVEDVRRYVEELGLWGCNLLVVWYDMHHFDGFDDPKAVAFRGRLHAIGEAAREVGMGIGFGVIANEGYNTTPAELRAENKGTQRGGWYDCQVCPSKPDGLALILKNLGQEFDWCADLHPEYVSLWPYDQGGCGCAQCRPWGTNGFLRVSTELAALARKKLPSAKITLSTWFFDEGEWRGLTEYFKNRKPWMDFVQADSGEGVPRYPLDIGVPGGVPLLNFPEISMWGRDPWGGYGANPTPARCAAQWKQTGGKLAGGLPYSEGIYEDINKAIWLQFYWDKDRPAEKTLEEYIASEFSPEVVDDTLRAIRLLEETWPGTSVGPKSLEARELLERVDAKLTPQAKAAWRWRILLLRAVIDDELHRNKGKLRGVVLGRAFDELTRIYHAQHADPWVRPPTME